MNQDLEQVFLRALLNDPADETTWLALADWLEESGQEPRAELLRLTRQLRRLPVLRRTASRARLEDRLLHLLQTGVRPAVPEIVNSIGIRLALIPAGVFRMGATRREPHVAFPEGPLREVTIHRPFFLGVFAVTQAQYRAVTRRTPAHFRPRGPRRQAVARMDTDHFPVDSVSWLEAMEFCCTLSELPGERQAQRRYRLPTEAEWEYACRGGASTTTPFGIGANLSAHLANFNGEHPEGDAPVGPNLERTCVVGSYLPNAFGLYDMHGNVWEWCHDWFDETYYRQSPSSDPPGPAIGEYRVLRGGSWANYGAACRAACRVRNTPDAHENIYGFRVALDWNPQE